MAGGPRLPTLPRNPFATAARRAPGCLSLLAAPRDDGPSLTRIAQPTVGTLLHSRKSLRPCETVRPASGFDQLHAPIVDLDRGNLMTRGARNVDGPAIRSYHDLLWRRRH